MDKKQKDWQGQDVPADETDDTVITVWEIEPHTSGAYTHGVIRGYQEAVAFAKSVLEGLMDEPDSEEELREEGLAVTMRLREMRLSEYQEMVQEAESNF